MSPDEAARSLESLSLQELREAWRRHGFGAPPALRAPDLVRRSLAWLIQTRAYGGVSPGLRRQLRGDGRLGDGLEPGARIVREWGGVRHEVEVVEGGYLYAGQRWTSLSPIARQITGTAWNGPAFFGLRRAGRS
jgi:Protein of unknown function (DUF2924)